MFLMFITSVLPFYLFEYYHIFFLLGNSKANGKNFTEQKKVKNYLS